MYPYIHPADSFRFIIAIAGKTTTPEEITTKVTTRAVATATTPEEAIAQVEIEEGEEVGAMGATTTGAAEGEVEVITEGMEITIEAGEMWSRRGSKPHVCFSFCFVPQFVLYPFM